MKKRVLCLLLALGMVMALCACNKSTDEPETLGTKPGDDPKWEEPTDEVLPDIPFDFPEEYECAVQIVMTPIVELYLDADRNIIAVRYLNQEAVAAFESVEKEICTSLEAGVKVLAEAAITSGYVKDDSSVVMRVVDDEEGVYDGVLVQVNAAFRAVMKEHEVSPRITVLMVDPGALDPTDDEGGEVETVTPDTDGGGVADNGGSQVEGNDGELED